MKPAVKAAWIEVFHYMSLIIYASHHNQVQDLLWFVGLVCNCISTCTHHPKKRPVAVGRSVLYLNIPIIPIIKRPILVVVGRPGQTRRPTLPRRLLSRARGASCALRLVKKIVHYNHYIITVDPLMTIFEPAMTLVSYRDPPH